MASDDSLECDLLDVMDEEMIVASESFEHQGEMECGEQMENPSIMDACSSFVCNTSTISKQIDSHKFLVCQIDTDERVSVLRKGIETFVQNCHVTGKDHLFRHLSALPNAQHLLHGSCRRRLQYASNKVTSHDSGESGNKQRLTRSVTGSFNFREMCFLCGEACAGSKDMRKMMSGKEFDSRLRRIIVDREHDLWAVSVLGRMDSVSDLFAADAIYHRNSYARFSKNLPHTPRKVKRGRPRNEDSMQAFEMLCDKLERECENEMYTLRDLHDMMCQMIEVDDVYSRRYLKELLQGRYGEHIYFVSRPGRDDVVGFRNFCDLLLHDKYFSDKNEGDGSEAESCSESSRNNIS
jgi:hypothetical protein